MKAQLIKENPALSFFHFHKTHIEFCCGDILELLLIFPEILVFTHSERDQSPGPNSQCLAS